jgi:hypothetical protein
LDGATLSPRVQSIDGRRDPTEIRIADSTSTAHYLTLRIVAESQDGRAAREVLSRLELFPKGPILFGIDNREPIPNGQGRTGPELESPHGRTNGREPVPESLVLIKQSQELRDRGTARIVGIMRSPAHLGINDPGIPSNTGSESVNVNLSPETERVAKPPA